jgi:HEAT repeat protein
MSRIERLVKLYQRGVITDGEARCQLLDLLNEESADSVLGTLSEEMLDKAIGWGLAAFFAAEAGLQLRTFHIGLPEFSSFETYRAPAGVAVRQWVESHWDARRLAALERESAIFGVAQVPPVARALIPQLLDALGDPNARVRRRALGALAAIEGPPEDVARRLIEELNEAETRPDWAHQFLAHVDPSASGLVPELERLLKHKARRIEVLHDMAIALGRIGIAARSALSELVEVAKSCKSPYRLESLEAISNVLGDDAAQHGEFMELVRDALAEPLGWFPIEAPLDWKSQCELAPALRLLARLPENAAGLILGDRDRAAMIRGFLDVTGPSRPYELAPFGPAAIPNLLAAMPDSSNMTRESAARELGQLGADAKGAVPYLMQAISDQHQAVRIAAAEALSRIGIGAEHVRTVSGFARDYNPTVRAWVCLILAESRVEFPEVGGWLIDRLRDPYPAVRIAAALGIRHFGREALPDGVDLIDRFVEEAFVVYPLDETTGKTPGLKQDAHRPLLEAFARHPDPRVSKSFARCPPSLDSQ